MGGYSAVGVSVGGYSPVDVSNGCECGCGVGGYLPEVVAAQASATEIEFGLHLHGQRWE